MPAVSRLRAAAVRGPFLNVGTGIEHAAWHHAIQPTTSGVRVGPAGVLGLALVDEMALEDIRLLRLRENASKAVFARILTVMAGLVSQWASGEKRPLDPPL